MHRKQAENISDTLPLQGNLDPFALMAGGEALESAVATILTAFKGRPHIFNLGHGISQFTPIEHVEKLISLVRKG
jgi:uroporphyrinogen decarboxylase